MLKKLLPLCLLALMSGAAHAADLVIAENGATDYQIVISDEAADEVVDNWLLMTAKLMEAAFQTNGFEVAVVRESAKAPAKPGIYLGATAFAKKNGIKVEQHDDWTYYQKVVGKDLIIAGNDKKDPLKTIRGTQTPLALLGTVKGVCDFLREHVGVRFLFINMAQDRLAPSGGAPDENGSLAIDTRSMAFLSVPRIAVPTDLDLQKTPMMRACADGTHETFYYIANNFFPLLSSIQGSTVHWEKIIPRAKYAASHPEYFALLPDGKRFCERPVTGSIGEEQHCPTHPEVQDLMARGIEELILKGEKTIMIMPPDGYYLCWCNCDTCMQLFEGMKAEGWQQVRERGKSGKLWQAYFAIAERVRQKYPEARIVLWDYQDTPITAISEFPENIIPKLQFGKQADFDRLEGIRIPAGICGLEETFTGFGVGGRYLPERTPEYIAGLVQSMARCNMQWTTRDGAIGNVRGLQAPAYYVYGRMLDDPTADWKDLQEEFCTAAFGDVAPTLTQFYDQLHEQIALYSDFFGIQMPCWNRKYGRSTYRGNKWHVMSMYPPEYCAAAEALLASAERRTKDPDVQARLRLLRIDFDYLSDLSRIYHLHSAWLLNPSPEFLNPLLDAIDAWRARIRLAVQGPIDGWPEMWAFNNHGYNHAALMGRSYQQLWAETCVNWDTEAIRGGILENEHRLSVPVVAEAPGIDADAWDQAPEQVFRIRGDMPFLSARTTLKVLRDRDHLYIRVDSLNPGEHPENIPEAKAEGDVFKQEHVELGLQPEAGGAIYRLAVNPTDGARYDAIWTRDAQGKPAEDVAWNGKWEFAFRTTGEKGPWSLGGRIWTAWFRIPFAELGGAAPAAGEPWGFNAARTRINPGITPQCQLWRDAPSVTDPKTLGTLVF